MKTQLKVLVVEDEIEIQKSIKHYFSFFEQIDIIFASSFLEAKQKIDSLHPPISIIDINLPDGNGLELIKIARKYSAANQVVIITGVSDLTRLIEALEFGAVEYLTKPLDMEFLKERVFEAVSRYKRWYKLIKMELQSKQKNG